MAADDVYKKRIDQHHARFHVLLLLLRSSSNKSIPTASWTEQHISCCSTSQLYRLVTF
jgi:hypothetical protein